MTPGRIAIAVALLLAHLAACATGDGNGRPSPAAHAPSAQPAGRSVPGDDGARFRVNPSHSRITAHVGVEGLLAAAGHPHTIALREFGGHVGFDEGHPDSTSLDLAIKAASLRDIGRESSERQREKVNRDLQEVALESARYPVIVFKGRAASVRVRGQGRYETTIVGDLTLHGATHQVSFPMTILWEPDHLRARGEILVLHSQYGMKRLSALAGAVKASNEIRLEFDLQADRQA